MAITGKLIAAVKRLQQVCLSRRERMLLKVEPILSMSDVKMMLVIILVMQLLHFRMTLPAVDLQ